MGIFGNLAEMQLQDLVPILRRRSGTLEIWGIDERDTRVRGVILDRTDVLCVRVDGQTLDAPQAKQVLAELSSARKGYFEFTDGMPERNWSHILNWPLDNMIASLTNSTREDVIDEASLPEAETRFEIKTTQLDNALDDSLFAFWARARAKLTDGASARDLAQGLGLPLDQVRRNFYKLRVSGNIQPVRLHTQLAADSERRGLASRLLRGLFRRK